MNYMLLSLYIFFYQWMINNKIKCGKDESKTDKNKIDLLKYYDKKATYINLHNKSLSSLPSRISEFQKLKQLYLYCNQFNEIPSDLSKLKLLDVLDMDGNRLNHFPTKVILKNLKCLYLANNEITFIKPSSDEYNILDLDEIYPNLKILNLSRNQIEYLPILQSKHLEILYLNRNKIMNIQSKMFMGLEKLIFLAITFNNLEEINNNLGEFKNLESIDLCGNKIKTFILNEDCLENLKYLDLNYNQIKEFKLEQSIVPRITIFSLMNNELSTIPLDIYNLKSLEELYLSDNDITEINDSISNLKNLKILDLYGNKISQIPESIIELINLNMFIISFEYLEKDYVPDCVMDIINDRSTTLTYKRYIKSKEMILKLYKLMKMKKD